MSHAEQLLANSLVGKADGTEATNAEKWWAAIILGLLFAILSSPLTYGITNMITTNLGFPRTCGGNSTPLFGIVLHTIVFILLVRWILN